MPARRPTPQSMRCERHRGWHLEGANDMKDGEPRTLQLTVGEFETLSREERRRVVRTLNESLESAGARWGCVGCHELVAKQIVVGDDYLCEQCCSRSGDNPTTADA